MMMSKHFIYLVFITFLTFQGKGQVIYERTFADAFPSMKETIELSDFSTVSFANNSPCYFAGWRHVSANGDIIQEGGLANESTHSLRTRQIAEDSILVSYRVGPFDFNGQNYFEIALWTPDLLKILVQDTVTYSYTEDCEWCNSPVHYEALLLHDNHILYQKGDTVYAKNLVSDEIDFKKSFAQLNLILPLKDGLMVFSENMPPAYYNDLLQPVYLWADPSSHPISFSTLVALDSFLVSVNLIDPKVLDVVNAINEEAYDIDLSIYFSKINQLVVRGETLLVVGKIGSTNTMLLLDKQLDIWGEKVFVVPDTMFEWTLSFHSERLYAWRTDGLSNYEANYRIAYVYNDPMPIAYLDLEVIDVIVDSVFYWPVDYHLPANLTLSAFVVNHSLDTLRNLTLHYEQNSLGECDSGVYPKHVIELIVPPGDTAIAEFSLSSWEVAMSQPFIRTFYTQHGNHHLDSDTTNNEFELVYLTSGINGSVETPIVVYPNPFTDFISITELRDLKLYNQMGVLVSEGKGQLNNLGALLAGLYTLQIIYGHTSYVQQVVKVE